MTDEPGKTPDLPAERCHPAEPDGQQRVAAFSADLRQMHQQAGKPSLRQMAMKVPYSHTALSNALRGVGGRIPSLELTLALVRACGGDEQEWQARWHREHAHITGRAPARNPQLSASATVPSENDGPRASRRLVRPILLAVFGALALVVGGVVVTVIWNTGAVHNFGLDGAPSPCVQSGSYDSCQIQQLADQISPDESSQQMKDHVLRFSNGAPRSPGPWPFVVWDTTITPEDIGIVHGVTQADVGRDLGVIVRSTPVQSGQTLSAVPSKSVLWADCYVETDFHPSVPADDDVGAKWLRVHWPNNFPSNASTHSLPNDRFVGYVYAGYTLPFTHNGKIPTCTWRH